MGQVEGLTELISELVRIESVNPDLVTSGSGETAIAHFVASWLSDAGLSVEIVEPVPGRPSVVGVLRGTGGGRSLKLNAHMDTVGAGGVANAFSPRVADGRVYGRGAYDMKASLAAILITAPEAAKLRLQGGLSITAERAPGRLRWREKSSPFMGKCRRKAGDGAAQRQGMAGPRNRLPLPTCWGGLGRGHPSQAKPRAKQDSSPFMRKYRPKAGDGAK